MEYIFFGVLTFLFIVLSFFTWKIYNQTLTNKTMPHRQSDNHIFLKEFFSRETKIKSKQSQLEKRKEKVRVKVIFTDDNKAYWVENNIFYVSGVINGKPDIKNAKRVETDKMSKSEVDKMLFILDNLRKGDYNERGGSGN